ncbi:MAG: glycosyltransferase family 2 protein [Oscillatoriales cyanobacterium SM2_1_8]|nr:glycosyltransferase family 2 protein [Oscillatoriales cyanobacterium SM2_1_8]
MSRLEPPLVSLCVPTYNGAAYLRETLSSALSQTYRPLEILIGDDGSTDPTLAIVEEFRALADRHGKTPVRIWPHRRDRPVDNWNFLAAEARGVYLKYLFQDDVLHPDCVAKLVALAESDGRLGLVFCRRALKSAQPLPADYGALYGDVSRGWHGLAALQPGLDLLGDGGFWQEPANKIGEPTNVLLRRETFWRLGGFDRELVQLVDWDLWLRFLGQSWIGFVPEELAAFRVHDRQLSRTHQQNGAAHLDLGKLYLKMLSRYDFLPAAIRQETWLRLAAYLHALHDEVQHLRHHNTAAHDRLAAIAADLAQTQTQFTVEVAQRDRHLQEAQTALAAAYAASHTLQTQLTGELTRLGADLAAVHTDRAHLGQQLQQMQDDLQAQAQAIAAYQAQIAAYQEQLTTAQNQIAFMEASFFWKLRNRWFALKARLGMK